MTTLFAHNDPIREKMYQAFLDGELIELWDIDKTEPNAVEGGRFPATYFQGYLTEWNESAGAEDSIEISLSMAINGSGARGHATLTDDQASAVQYVFADTTVAND